MSGHIAALNDSVTRKKVVYKNRYGLEIMGELYYAKDMDLTQKHPALIVGAPYGGVKEQGPCVYGSELAQRDFVVLTFDQSFMGESGGFPRNVSSPDIFTENFSAAVDFLGLQSFVEREKIGAIGICGSGGFALSAAQMDTRIRAVATASMYDMSVAVRGGQDRAALQAVKAQLSAQRWKDAENGYPEYLPGFPEQPIEEVPANIPEPDAEWMRFYAVKRGHHPNARGGFTTTSALAMMNFPLLAHSVCGRRPGALQVFQRECLYRRAGAEGAVRSCRRGAHRPLRPHRPDPLRQAGGVLPLQSEIKGEVQ